MQKPLTIVEHSWEETSIYSPERDYPIATLRIDPDVTEETQDKYEAITRAHAEEIVRAVNAHDDLVAALKLAEKELLWAYDNIDHAGLKLAADECRAALTKARGEGKTA